MTITVELTPEQVSRLNNLASATGRGTDELMREAVENLLAYDAWFQEQVAVGKAQSARGELLDDEDVRERINRMFQS